jgi:ABC-2 type transport system permease protein
MSSADERTRPVGTAEPERGVIHDIGYRHYEGRRLGPRYVQRALFADSLRGAYGIGRSARSKIMPVLLVVLMCLPAVVIVIITAVTGSTELPLGYTSYAYNLQVVVAIYVAAQSPAIVSRDLRYRVMPLYLARPLQRAQYVQAKLAAMSTAVFALLALPFTILFAGALLAKLPITEQLPEFIRGLAGAVLYAVVLAAIGLVIAALTPRRGLGVAAVIAVLLVLSGVQAIVMSIAGELGKATFAGYSGLLSPFSLVDGVLSGVFGADSAMGAGPPGAAGAAVFTGALVLLLVACYGALLARYRRVPVS